jgi:DNA repair protein SbcD/Mre11
MKLLHVSDIHFGVENYSRIDTVTGLPTRLKDFVDAFDRAIDVALQEGVDAVLFTGDAYKNRDPNPTVQREFAKRIKRFVDKNIPVFLLTGNHDLPGMVTRAHSLEIFETLAITGVQVARGIQLFTIPTKSGPLQIISIPWLTRQNLLARDEYRGRTMEELNALMMDKMEGLLNEKIRQLDTSHPSVLAVHATIYGASESSERDIMLGNDFVIQKSQLGAEHFDYIAVGHIHKHQELVAGDTSIVYPGSMERVNFREQDDPKGFVLIDIDNTSGTKAGRRTSWRFVEDSKVRSFRTLDLNIENIETSDLLNPTAAAVQELQRKVERLNGNGLHGAIVRVRLKLREEQRKSLREDELRRALEEAGTYYIAGIERQVEQSRRIRLTGDAIEGLGPIELLERYLETRSVPAERIELLVKHAKGLMHGTPDF